MSLSVGLMRKIHGLPPTPDWSEMLGAEATPPTIGILASLIKGMVANVAELQWAPTIATTLASISLLATFTARGIAMIVELQNLDLPAEEPAGAIDLVDREIDAPPLPHRRGRRRTGDRRDFQPDEDGLRGRGRGEE